MHARLTTAAAATLALRRGGCASMPHAPCPCRLPATELPDGTGWNGDRRIAGGQIGAGAGRHVAIAAGSGMGAVTGSRINWPYVPTRRSARSAFPRAAFARSAARLVGRQSQQ